jgi:CoA-dependent NAD(P)H sulfur oxidoreductase
MKFLVIGGDAAGMSAASRAKRNMPDLDVTVLEKTGDVSYSACGMPYNIADQSREMEDLVVRQAQVFREKQGINLLIGHLAESIDPLGKKVSGITAKGKRFEFTYDKLLIATGGRAIIPDLPGLDHPGVHVLKSLEHGRRIKEYIQKNPVKKAVIIGMGYIGLEMCEALRSLSIQVDMVKPGPVFLPWMDRELSESIQAELASHDVGVHMGCPVENVESSGKGIRLNCSGRTLDADMVLSAMGILPNIELAENAGIQTSVSRSIAVDRSLKTSDDHIYAAGDCADAYHVVTGQKTWIPLALRANRAGWAVADNVCGGKMELPGIVGTAVFRVFNKEVARTGLSEKEAAGFSFDPISITITSRSRAHAHPGSSPIQVHMTGDRKTGLLLGVQMVGDEGVAHRINAAAVALHSRMTVEQFSQTDLAYAPPFGPVWDPLLTAANQLLKKMNS